MYMYIRLNYTFIIKKSCYIIFYGLGFIYTLLYDIILNYLLHKKLKPKTIWFIYKVDHIFANKNCRPRHQNYKNMPTAKCPNLKKAVPWTGPQSQMVPMQSYLYHAYY